jgi:hypothetical protein
MKDRTETLEIGSLAPVLFAGRGQPRGHVHSRWSARPGHADSRVSARNLVTELREAHDSVRVAANRRLKRRERSWRLLPPKSATASGSRENFWRSIRSPASFLLDEDRTVTKSLRTSPRARRRCHQHRAPGHAGDRSRAIGCATSIAAITSSTGRRSMRLSELCKRSPKNLANEFGGKRQHEKNTFADIAHPDREVSRGRKLPCPPAPPSR